LVLLASDNDSFDILLILFDEIIYFKMGGIEIFYVKNKNKL